MGEEKEKEGRGACNLGVYLCRAQKETDSTLDNIKPFESPKNVFF